MSLPPRSCGLVAAVRSSGPRAKLASPKPLPFGLRFLNACSITIQMLWRRRRWSRFSPICRQRFSCRPLYQPSAECPLLDEDVTLIIDPRTPLPTSEREASRHRPIRECHGRQDEGPRETSPAGGRQAAQTAAVVQKKGGNCHRSNNTPPWRASSLCSASRTVRLRSFGFGTPPLTQPPQRGGFVVGQSCGLFGWGSAGVSWSATPLPAGDAGPMPRSLDVATVAVGLGRGR